MRLVQAAEIPIYRDAQHFRWQNTSAAFPLAENSSTDLENAGSDLRSTWEAAGNEGNAPASQWYFGCVLQSSAFRGMGELWRTSDVPLPCWGVSPSEPKAPHVDHFKRRL